MGQIREQDERFLGSQSFLAPPFHVQAAFIGLDLGFTLPPVILGGHDLGQGPV